MSISDNAKPHDSIIKLDKVSIYYDHIQAINNVSFPIAKHHITAIIGPSGCGKSSLLRAMNRMNDFIPALRLEGKILFNDIDLHDKTIDPVTIRRQIGMVFQKPNPFPKSIAKNITWAPSINGYQGVLDDLIETSLRRAALWDEVKDRLKDSALQLSGGQQQRLCIARALAMQPDVLLLDEPCSALDPVSTARIEDLLFELKAHYSIVIVTHNMQQAARLSDYTAFLHNGALIEFGQTNQIFTCPVQKRTEDYVTGRFG